MQDMDEVKKEAIIYYTNYRGETAERRIVPTKIWFGSNEWHPEPQWLLEALDVEKKCRTNVHIVHYSSLAKRIIREGETVRTAPLRNDLYRFEEVGCLLRASPSKLRSWTLSLDRSHRQCGCQASRRRT